MIKDAEIKRYLYDHFLSLEENRYSDKPYQQRY